MLDLPITRYRAITLALLAAATILWIGANLDILGAIIWLISFVLTLRDEALEVRRRQGVLLIVVAMLGAIDINPSLDDANFIRLSLAFFLALTIPYFWLKLRGDGEVIRYRFLPKKRRWADPIYTVLSVPLAIGILLLYAWGNEIIFGNELFRQWTLPEPDPDLGGIRRLFIGINLVGIWDELFFINTSFAILRSLYRFPIANALQAVLYTALLFDMAFVGLGAIIVFLFALTQGSMYEKSEGLLWVLIVHLIVDFVLVYLIVNTYYPGYGAGFLLRKGF